MVPGPEAKSSSEITNLTPFTISYWCGGSKMDFLKMGAIEACLFASGNGSVEKKRKPHRGPNQSPPK